VARLHEYQAKAVLQSTGLAVPNGTVAHSLEQARAAATALNGKCVVKIQAWTTGRAAIGGIALCETVEQAVDAAERMLDMRVGRFPVESVLVEERLEIAHELFVSFTIDDSLRQPVLLLSATGGSGIENRSGGVTRIPCDLVNGPATENIRQVLESAQLSNSIIPTLIEAISTAYRAMRTIEARSLEINPLAITADNRIVAADCRMTIDDYAAYRHPELGIEIAREFDHPPTTLERIAYEI